MKENIQYPFTAIVGQERMKQALILNIINPRLGGVLIRGEKGTAKSTAVRALAALMPTLQKVKGCRFGCDPDGTDFCPECEAHLEAGEPLERTEGKMQVIDLPVSATEDRVVGTLDIEYAISHGTKKFECGILAQANRNILYVDEVNLLDDHVVDVLLDSAAMGVNTVEREGISYSHPARFTLVGTMNPEEGDLRPQLLDRFGLVVDVCGENSKEQRAEVVRRRLEFEENPEQFARQYEPEQQRLAGQILQAKERLGSVRYENEILLMAAALSLTLGVDGHRADITMIKTAMTLAAFEGRTKVSREDLKNAAVLVLPHRMRRTPFENGVLDEAAIEQILREHA
ncbi:MAG: ATP-binding protein [Eubacteriales bacterium]|nr:ATP-binding protein [Eubacteriales bacterium]